MELAHDHFRPIPGAVATAGVDVRMAFIKKTYAHLAGAVAAFIALLYFMTTTGVALQWALWVGAGPINMLVGLGLFIGAGHLADWWARSDRSRTMQYLGLGLYTAIMALMVSPLVYIAAYYVPSDPYILHKAGFITLFVFGGLTATVFLTKKDFSFMGGFLKMALMTAMGLIVLSIIFGFGLGTWFSGAMILLFSGCILYSTSRVLGHYPPTHHVAAALELFSSLAILFFYVLRLLLALASE